MTRGRCFARLGKGRWPFSAATTADDLAFFGPLSDWRTTQATAAERAFLSVLDAGCSLPVAAYAHVDGNRLLLQGRVSRWMGAGRWMSPAKPARLRASPE